MNEDTAVALSLFGTIVTWALAWLLIVDHRNKRGENIFVSHLLGIFIGSGAAFGAFCVTGALFLPNDSANTAIGIGIVGAAILSVYWLAFLFSKRTVVRQQQNKTVDYKVMRQKNDAAQQQKSEQRTQKTQILGMSFGNFYQERSESHLKFWLAIFFFAAVIYVAVFMLVDSDLDGFTRFLVGFVGVTLAATMYAVSCLLIVPIIFILLVLFPFISFSIFLEARLRMWKNIPYVSPILDSYAVSDITSASSTNNHWVFPFAMGLWLGHMWGDDD